MYKMRYDECSMDGCRQLKKEGTQVCRDCLVKLRVSFLQDNETNQDDNNASTILSMTRTSSCDENTEKTNDENVPSDDLNVSNDEIDLKSLNDDYTTTTCRNCLSPIVKWPCRSCYDECGCKKQWKSVDTQLCKECVLCLRDAPVLSRKRSLVDDDDNDLSSRKVRRVVYKDTSLQTETPPNTFQISTPQTPTKRRDDNTHTKMSLCQPYPHTSQEWTPKSVIR